MFGLISLQTKSLLPAPSGFAPSLTWQRNQVADFAEVRQVRITSHDAVSC